MYLLCDSNLRMYLLFESNLRIYLLFDSNLRIYLLFDSNLRIHSLFDSKRFSNGPARTLYSNSPGAKPGPGRFQVGSFSPKRTAAGPNLEPLI